MSKSDRAKEYFEKGYNCAQSILAAFAPDAGITEEAAFKTAFGLGGGCAHHGEICGAVSSALMVYGMRFGSDKVKDELAEEIVFHLADEHVKEFRELFGKIRCSELLGFQISDPDEYAKILEEDLFKLKCPRFVFESALILEQNLEKIHRRRHG